MKMKKVQRIGIVSLSSGILGEPFISFEVQIGLQRLKQMGIDVRFGKNALKGMEYLKQHPEKRAADLLDMFVDDQIDMILCAIGGDDTYRLAPYLFEHDELANAVQNHPKIFLGYSDTTVNHFMFNKVGMKTFYGQAFLPDICELDQQMLPYTQSYFEQLIQTGHISKIMPSPLWYESRQSYDASCVGIPLSAHPDQGWLQLQGSPIFHGEILGGCLESMYDMLTHHRYPDTDQVCQKYGLFPKLEQWKGKILLLETSEEKPTPKLYEEMLTTLKDQGIFKELQGILVGKPMDETYFEEYRVILCRVVDRPDLPIVYNLNVGHAFPHCILPLNEMVEVNVNQQVIQVLPTK